VVNNSREACSQAKVAVEGRRPRLLSVDWEGELNPRGNGAADHRRGEDWCEVQPWLSPGQMELYRLEEGG